MLAIFTTCLVLLSLFFSNLRNKNALSRLLLFFVVIFLIVFFYWSVSGEIRFSALTTLLTFIVSSWDGLASYALVWPAGVLTSFANFISLLNSLVV